MRKKIVAGNWKMNKTMAEAISFCESIGGNALANTEDVDILVFPTSLYISSTQGSLKNSMIHVGAQNCHFEDKGAYTGETSVEMLKSMNVKHCLVGHSERRVLFGETDEDVAKKVEKLVAQNITPIVCIGESLEERKNEQHFPINKRQLEAAFQRLNEEGVSKAVIAYEPVWAIGTGLTASAEQAQEMHHFIRNWVNNSFGNDVGGAIRILYGGSCKPTNAKELFSCPDIDGGLIGGASLVESDFLKLIEVARNLN